MKNISSILIANRGEIVIRIIRTCKKLGIKTYAIKTDKEPDSLYLKYADEIIDFTNNLEEIPEFLDIEKIIEAIKKHNISAVHPGYGFLAENPYFANRCKDENIIFIGPNPDAIYKMGNKTIAKQIARKIKIPLVEGSKENISSEEEAIQIANSIGYPVIIKAASGGGGKGMRIVESASEMGKMFRLASNEAEKSFNDASCFVERYVRNPKHVEFQIVGDKFGNVIHLGERECSVQRKHQKMIEEAPSPALTPELRKIMGDEAIKIASAVKYDSVGTVEFLLDADNNFYFMEMNTRIQVEHPVTEEVTGVDLVEIMLRIADGQPLKLTQKDIKINGWAIECRINAEDIQNNFAPNTGLIELISFPKGKNIRVETGIESGSSITSYYDSMIAKLIVTGEDRPKAISNTLAALKKIRLKGLRTTIPFHKQVMRNEKFISGDYTTSFIEKDIPHLVDNDMDKEKVAAFITAFEYAREFEKYMSDEKQNNEFTNSNPWLLHNRMRSL